MRPTVGGVSELAEAPYFLPRLGVNRFRFAQQRFGLRQQPRVIGERDRVAQPRPLAVVIHCGQRQPGIAAQKNLTIRERRPQPLVLHPGEAGRPAVEVSGAAGEETGTVALVSPVPSVAMQGAPAPFRVRPGETVRVEVPVSVRADADWGRKTVVWRVETAHGAAVLFRPLEIQPNADVRPMPLTLDGRRPRLTLVNMPPPGASDCGRASGIMVEVDGQQVSFGDIAGGQRVTRALPIAQPFAGRARLGKVHARISYTLWGEPVERECDLDLAVVPAQVAGPPQALAAVYVFNARDEALENYPVIVDLPSSLSALAQRLYVTDQQGRPLPSQVDFAAQLAFVGRVPAASAAAFYLALAPSKAERPSAAGEMEIAVEPLSRLTGTVRLSNSRLSVVLLAPRGGVVSSLRSTASGRDYAAQSLGVSYGRWSRPVDAARPARGPQELIDEQRVRQADSPAQVEVLSAGPVRAIAQVTWRDEHVSCRQTYELRAFQPYLLVKSEVTPTAGGAPPAGGEVEAYVFVHQGNQAVAQAFQRALERPPLIVMAEVSRAGTVPTLYGQGMPCP